MDAPPNTPIPAGQLHRAFRPLEVLVYDYDELGVRTRVLPAGSVFQPWEPEPHWRGVKVPITLGAEAKGFDWGVTSPVGYFLSWRNFFSACGTGAAPPYPGPGGERRLDAFAELDAIRTRLRARAPGVIGGPSMLEELLAIEAKLAKLHAGAAEMELGASGFDNMETVRRYAAVQERLLEAAREILAACKTLVE